MGLRHLPKSRIGAADLHDHIGVFYVVYERSCDLIWRVSVRLSRKHTIEINVK
jgi:hypothetical protein